MKTIVFFLLFVVCPVGVSGQEKNLTFPKPVGFVNDFAEVIDPATEARLEERLRRFRDTTRNSPEITVVTVKTTGKTDIFNYSLALARSWGVGPRTKPSYGVLLLIAVDDRKYFTQVSRDAETIFSNSYVANIQRRILEPVFKEGDYGAGLWSVVNAYLTRFDGFRQTDRRKFYQSEETHSLSSSLQAVVVTVKDWNAVRGAAQLFERPNANAPWKNIGASFPVVIGKNGLAYAEDFITEKKISAAFTKKEGDGKSPAGIFDLTAAFGTAAKSDSIKLPYTELEEGTECVDDTKSLHYNRIVSRTQVGVFDWKSSEKMLAVGEQYDLGVFVAHNSTPVTRGNGSCIFLHVWRDDKTGTAGCTAMSRADMTKVLRRLDAAKHPVLIQLTEDAYKLYQNSWNLPKIK